MVFNTRGNLIQSSSLAPRTMHELLLGRFFNCDFWLFQSNLLLLLDLLRDKPVCSGSSFSVNRRNTVKVFAENTSDWTYLTMQTFGQEFTKQLQSLGVRRAWGIVCTLCQEKQISHIFSFVMRSADTWWRQVHNETITLCHLSPSYPCGHRTPQPRLQAPTRMCHQPIPCMLALALGWAWGWTSPAHIFFVVLTGVKN